MPSVHLSYLLRVVIDEILLWDVITYTLSCGQVSMYNHVNKDLIKQLVILLS